MRTRPRVTIVGGGFGGIAAAQRLRRANVDVLLIDWHNHYVFQPLLYQVASATLAPSDIAVPIRWYLRGQANTEVLLGEVTTILPSERTVIVDGTRVEAYDFHVVAAGSRHAYFGRPAWEAFAPGLKSLDDALEIRTRFLEAFEQAEATQDAAEREALQTIVIVGGGPAGLSWRASWCTSPIAPCAPTFVASTRRGQVLLVEGGSRLLPAMPEELSVRALNDLREMGVEVRLDTMVTEVTPTHVRLGDEVIATRTVIWAAGNAASPLGRQLNAPTDRFGRVVVEPDLSVPGHPEVFVVGDMAVTAQPDGRRSPEWRREGGARRTISCERSSGVPGDPSATRTAATWPR